MVIAPVLKLMVGPTIVIDRALAVRDVDAGIVDDDRRAGRALQHDPAGCRRRRHVADHHHVLQQRLDDDVRVGRVAGERHRRHAGGRVAPAAADPDRPVGVALLETRPRPRRRSAAPCRRPSAVRSARPAARTAPPRSTANGSARRARCSMQPARIFGSMLVVTVALYIPGYGVALARFAHTGTLGVMEISPSRVS